MSPLDQQLAVLRGLYPQARVTSGYRDPNSPLGRENPRSYHNIGQAFDVAPIPGVSFPDYVSNLKAHGVPVVEALDEASKPAFDTTGPNWHIAFGAQPTMAPYYAPKRKPVTLADLGPSRFPIANGIDPFAALNPPSAAGPIDPGMSAQPMTLADLGASKYPVANGVDPLAPQKKKSPFTVGNALGVLGDALMAYGGMQPEFGPTLAKQAEDDKQLAFDREKMNAELQIARDKALEPPQFVQDAAAWSQLSPQDQQQVLNYRNAMFPVVAGVQQPNGSVINTVIPRQLPPKVGEVQDGYMYVGGDPSNPNSWKAQ